MKQIKSICVCVCPQVFKLGPQGLGYYTDRGPMAVSAAAAGGRQPQPAQPAAAARANASGSGQPGWVGMRTVAALRREQGVGAPRHTDSLYRTIERAPRKFNPLHIPKTLQVRYTHTCTHMCIHIHSLAMQSQWTRGGLCICAWCVRVCVCVCV